MSNRLYENKRSSLDFSESNSDEDDYRGESSARRNDFGESYNSNEPPYSPDSYDAYGRPNPKSILKENSVSASKSKRNIVINETLNETHRIAQKGESSKTSPEKHSVDESDKYRGYIREDKYASGTSGTSDQSPGKEGSYEDEEEEEYESKMSSKYSKDGYDDNVPSGFKNRLVVGQQGQTDFQRAHDKKIQNEIDQGYSAKGLRQTPGESEKRGLETDDLEDKRGKGKSNWEEESKGHERKDDRSQGYGGLGLSDKKESSGSRHGDPGSKFERMEQKIQALERELNDQSKNLMGNSIRYNEKSQSLDKVYEDFEYRMKELKDDIDQSINDKQRSKIGFESEEKHKRGKTAETGERYSHEGTGKGVKGRKSSERISGGTKKGYSTSFKKLQEEIERLKEENEYLQERVVEKEQRDREKTIKASAIVDTDMSRKKEILETIERIKKKLRKSITKKMKKERENEIAKTLDETAAKALGRNFTSYGLHYKDVLKRKALEEKTSVKNNAHLLHKGVPTTYKDYESPVFAEKLGKTAKK